VLLQSWANAELWFKKDDHFSTPKGNISLEITTNDLGFGKSPIARVFAQLWADCLKEYIFEFNFMAVSADLGFNLTLGNDTI
jgi:secreted Zn-dependent insulinase-like peptidase